MGATANYCASTAPVRRWVLLVVGSSKPKPEKRAGVVITQLSRALQPPMPMRKLLYSTSCTTVQEKPCLINIANRGFLLFIFEGAYEYSTIYRPYRTVGKLLRVL
jgi:hypothetical protein